MLAALIDGVSETGATERRRRGRRTPRRQRRRRHRQGAQRRQPRLGPVRRRDVLGRHRPAAVDAAPGPGQLRHRLGRQRGAARALRGHLGGDGDHRARHRLRLRQHHHHGGARTATSTSSTARRSTSPPASAPTSVVVWATLDKELGRAAIKSFLVRKGNPGLKVERLEHKLGIRASDTAVITFTDCRVPAEDLLGSPEIDTKSGFAGAMATFDNTRPLVAAMAVGLRPRLARPDPRPARAGRRRGRLRPARRRCSSAAAAKFLQLEADWEGAKLLMMQAAWMADNRKPNSLEASMAKAKAGRVGSDVTLSCVAAVRHARLQRGRAAGEVGARLQDPRHLRGHPADPAADRRPPGPRADQRRAPLTGLAVHMTKPPPGRSGRGLRVVGVRRRP